VQKVCITKSNLNKFSRASEICAIVFFRQAHNATTVEAYNGLDQSQRRLFETNVTEKETICWNELNELTYLDCDIPLLLDNMAHFDQPMDRIIKKEYTTNCFLTLFMTLFSGCGHTGDRLKLLTINGIGS
jgi:hypothetical protein